VLAVKVSRDGNQQSLDCIKKELYHHKELQMNKVTCIPKVFGDGYFNKNQFIKSEYAEYSIEEYLEKKDIPDKLSFQQILI